MFGDYRGYVPLSHDSTSRSMQLALTESRQLDNGSNGFNASNVDSASDDSSVSGDAYAPHCHSEVKDGRCSHHDIIQFNAPIFYVEEHDDNFHVDVMRVGSGEGGYHSVTYHTEDGSAKAGLQYEAVSGEITFGPEDHIKSIQVPIIGSVNWNPTLEFKVVLTNPVRCELGKYLYFCRVKVIDDDTFPSSKYRKELSEGEDGVDQIAGMPLFLQYCKLNFFQNEGICLWTVFSIFLDQMQNLYLLFKLHVNMYFVDVLFSKDPADEEWFKATSPFETHQETAQVIALLYVLPMFLLHFWDYNKIKLDIFGKSRLFLQTNLFRKYLNFSEASRMKVRPSDMHVATTHDAGELADGYVAMLEIVQIIGKLLVLITFILHKNPRAIIYVILMPCLMLLFGLCRVNTLLDASEVVGEREVDMIAIVGETCNSYRLIAEYHQRPQMNEVFKKKADDLRTAEIPESQIKMNNNYFPKWLGPLFTAFYIATQAASVITYYNPDGTIKLGAFLATMHIFGEISNDFSELYKVVMRVTRRFDPLKGITTYFNLETDLNEWKEVNSRRHQQMYEHIEQQSVDTQNCSNMFDRQTIRICNMSQTFIDPNQKDPDITLFTDVNLEVAQGKMVAIVGQHGAGRSTFLKLIGQAIFPPTTGCIFVPTHLRILHVSQEPVMLLLSPWRNLTFGLEQSDIDPERVCNILEELKMRKMHAIVEDHLANVAMMKKNTATPRSVGSESIDDEIEREEEEGETGEEVDRHKLHHGWQEPLTYSEKVKTHLARAFIMNPEVMVLQRPLYHFGPKGAENMLRHIRKHVDNRGLCLPEDANHKRRPRTVFFSPETKEQAKVADLIWQIDKDKKTVTELTLSDPRLQDAMPV